MNSSSKTLLALVLLAAPAAAARLEDTVAVVNGTPILLSDFQKDFAEAKEFWQRRAPEAMEDPTHVRKLRESVLEQLIDRELLYQEGTKLKLKVRERDIDNGVAEVRARFGVDESGRKLTESESDAELQNQIKKMGMTYAQFRERISRQIMARKVIDEAVRARIKMPEEKEVRVYFDRVVAYIKTNSTTTPKGLEGEEAMAFMEAAAQVKAMSSERVRVSRILVKYSPGATPAEKKRALKTAQELRKKITDGAEFAAVAREESEDPESAARGGDIGYVVRGVSPPDFEKAAFSLPVGDISEPIDTELGYNVIRVQEKRAAEAPEFERFKEDLGRFIANLGYQKELESYVKSLKSKAVIERNLPS
jgi:parvulin-like peptidyl-prolyl isomerase